MGLLTSILVTSLVGGVGSAARARSAVATPDDTSAELLVDATMAEREAQLDALADALSRRAMSRIDRSVERLFEVEIDQLARAEDAKLAAAIDRTSRFAIAQLSSRAGPPFNQPERPATLAEHRPNERSEVASLDEGPPSELPGAPARSEH